MPLNQTYGADSPFRNSFSKLLSITLKSIHRSSKNTVQDPLGSTADESGMPQLDKWGHHSTLTTHNKTVSLLHESGHYLLDQQV